MSWQQEAYLVIDDPPFCHFFFPFGEGDFLNFLGGDGECDLCLLGGEREELFLRFGFSLLSQSLLATGDLDRDLFCVLFLSGDLEKQKQKNYKKNSYFIVDNNVEEFKKAFP